MGSHAGWFGRLAAFGATAALFSGGALAQSDATGTIAIGESRSGVLDESDPHENRGYVDAYTFHADGGENVAIALDASFDAYLVLENPNGVPVAEDDDGGTGTNSRLTATLGEAGAWTIIVTSFGSGTTGSYTLTVERDERLPLSIDRIAVGERVSGTLGTGDGRIAGGQYADAWDVELEQGETVTIAMSGFDMDALIHVVGPTGERVAMNDDSPDGGLDSLLVFTPRYSGVYRILATTYFGGETGQYELSVTEGRSTRLSGAVEIEAGEDVEGELTEDAGQSPAGTHEVVYAIDVSAGQFIEVDMRSDAIDSYVRIYDQYGYVAVENDDSHGSLDSRAIYMAPTTGRYMIGASSSNGQLGAFTLRVELVAPGPVVHRPIELGDRVEDTIVETDPRRVDTSLPVHVYSFDATAGDIIDIRSGVPDSENLMFLRLTLPTGETHYGEEMYYDSSSIGLTAPHTGTYLVTVMSYNPTPVHYWFSVEAGGEVSGGDRLVLPVGTPVAGRLEESDGVMGFERRDVYRLVIEESGTYRLAAVSDDIDGVLELLDEDGNFMARNDDANGLNPGLEHYLAAGEYQVVMTQYDDVEGPYMLTADRIADRFPQIEEAIVGDRIAGSLDATDALTELRGTPADYFRVELGAGQSVTIVLRSDAFDPYLTLLDPSGDLAAQDDDSAGNFDAQIRFTAPLSGVYTISAGAFGEASGPYELTIEEGITGATGTEL